MLVLRGRSRRRRAPIVPELGTRSRAALSIAGRSGCACGAPSRPTGPSANTACSKWRLPSASTLSTAARSGHRRCRPGSRACACGRRAARSRRAAAPRCRRSRPASASFRRSSSSSRLRGCTSRVTACASVSKLGSAPSRGSARGAPAVSQVGGVAEPVREHLAGQRARPRAARRRRDCTSRVTSRRLMPVAVLMRLTLRCGATCGWAAAAACTTACFSDSSSAAIRQAALHRQPRQRRQHAHARRPAAPGLRHRAWRIVGHRGGGSRAGLHWNSSAPAGAPGRAASQCRGGSSDAASVLEVDPGGLQSPCGRPRACP